MRKFKILLLSFIAMFFIACSSTQPTISVNTSEAIFITPKQGENRVFVTFKNSANIAENNTTAYIKNELINSGFKIANDVDSADFVILGDIVSFVRLEHSDFNPNFNIGFGRRYWGFGFGFPIFARDFDTAYTNSYYYTLNASVLIKSKDGLQKSTMITLKNEGHTYSVSYILPYLNERLARQIVGFFYELK